jgi:hypothetical protein
MNANKNDLAAKKHKMHKKKIFTTEYREHPQAEGISAISRWSRFSDTTG